jgi:hypothetical protein
MAVYAIAFDEIELSEQDRSDPAGAQRVHTYYSLFSEVPNKSGPVPMPKCLNAATRSVSPHGRLRRLLGTPQIQYRRHRARLRSGLR